MHKSGFVTIIGRPNVGKSTFMNKVLGQKVSIVSPKAQTTRNKIRGIYNRSDAQIIFIDTPGIHKPQNALGSVMNDYSIASIKDTDAVIWIIDGNVLFGKGDMFIGELLKKCNNDVFLVVNKIDIIKNEKKFNENVENFKKLHHFKNVSFISALNGDNVDSLIENIINSLEEGPAYYPKDQISDNPESFIISELIREKILLLTKEEVPHSIAVVTEQMTRDKDGLLNIYACIFVDRDSQKKIIIGSKGSMIKEIGTLARKDIVMLLGEKIYLELWVKVESDWREKRNILKRFGYYKDN